MPNADQCRSIDRHWALIGRVLYIAQEQPPMGPQQENGRTFFGFPIQSGSILEIGSLEISIDQHQALTQHVLLYIKG